MNTLHEIIRYRFDVALDGLPLAGSLDGPVNELTSLDQMCDRYLESYEIELSILFRAAEICARAIRGQTSTSIASLPKSDQFEILLALEFIIEVIEETWNDEETLKKISALKVVSNDFAKREFEREFFII